MRLAVGLLAWLCAAACAPASGGGQEALRLISSAQECEFGQPFLLTVERSWRAGAEPPAWDPASLAPLALEWESMNRQVTDGVTRETQLFRARAFTLGTLSFAPHFDLAVRSGLPPDDSGQPESPSPASVNRPWIMLSLLALSCGVFVVLRARRRPVTVPNAPPAPSTASERLQQLQPDAAEFPAQLTAVLRDWLAERAGLSAPGRLVEEFLSGESSLAPAARAELKSIVRSCEECRFAGGAWSEDQRQKALASARALVEERP